MLDYFGKVIKYYSYFYVGSSYIFPINFIMCKDHSMEPTLRKNDIIIAEKSSVRRENINKYFFSLQKKLFK